MSLMNHFLKRRKVLSEAVEDSEILTSVLIPSGHHERYILRNEAEAFFAPYMEFLCQSLAEAYDVKSIARRQKESKNGYYATFIDTPFLRVEYKVSPIEVLDGKPSIFYGEMNIKQPHIDLGIAGKLHRTLLDAHPGQGFTLSYTPGDDTGFQIFYSKGDRILSQGETLLQKMGLQTPLQGLSYTQRGNTRFWLKVPIELRQ